MLRSHFHETFRWGLVFADGVTTDEERRLHRAAPRHLPRHNKNVRGSSALRFLPCPRFASFTLVPPPPPVRWRAPIDDERRRCDWHSYNYVVRRRFSDFEWLRAVLVNRFTGLFIPALPPKELQVVRCRAMRCRAMKRLDAREPSVGHHRASLSAAPENCTRAGQHLQELEQRPVQERVHHGRAHS